MDGRDICATVRARDGLYQVNLDRICSTDAMPSTLFPEQLEAADSRPRIAQRRWRGLQRDVNATWYKNLEEQVFRAMPEAGFGKKWVLLEQSRCAVYGRASTAAALRCVSQGRAISEIIDLPSPQSPHNTQQRPNYPTEPVPSTSFGSTLFETAAPEELEVQRPPAPAAAALSHSVFFPPLEGPQEGGVNSPPHTVSGSPPLKRPRREEATSSGTKGKSSILAPSRTDKNVLASFRRTKKIPSPLYPRSPPPSF